MANYFHYKSVIEFYYDITKGIFNLKKIGEYLNFIEKIKIKDEKLIVENKSKKIINKKTSNSLILFDGNNQTVRLFNFFML